MYDFEKKYAMSSSIGKLFKNICGIYCIFNTKSQKIYIGSTKDVEMRWRSHRKTLVRGKHRNPHLQYSFNCYGIDQFQFSVIEECPEEALLEKEQKWMDYYNSYDDKFGYNIIPRADRKVFTKEHRENLSKAHMGNKHTPETKEKIRQSSTGRIMYHSRKPVFQYTVDGKLIKKYDCLLEASKQTGICDVLIGESCKNKKAISGKGYLWFFEKGFSDSQLQDRIKQYKSIQDRRVAKLRKKLNKRVIKCGRDGDVVEEYPSVKEAARKNDICFATASRILNGRCKNPKILLRFKK